MCRFLGKEYTITYVQKNGHENIYELMDDHGVIGCFWSDWMIRIPIYDPIEEIKEGEQNSAFEMLFL